MGLTIGHVMAMRKYSGPGVQKNAAINTYVLPREDHKPSIYPNTQQALVYFTSSNRVSLKSLLAKVDSNRLKNRVEYLASDELSGRIPNSNGIQKAQDYIISQFKLAGLKPFEALGCQDFVQKAVFQTVYQECKQYKDTGHYNKLPDDRALKLDSKKYTINNLIGCLPAKNKSDKYIFVTAHYDHLGRDHDTGKVYTGADDNASGISALLEMARVLSGTQPNKNIVFVATSGEEMGTLGASYLAKQLGIKGFEGKVEVVNMDCLAARGDFMTIEGGGPQANKKIQQTAIKAAEKLNIAYETPAKNDRTDAEAFEKAGFPAITFLWAWQNDMENRQHYHKTTDRTDIADFSNLKKSTDLALSTVWLLANS